MRFRARTVQQPASSRSGTTGTPQDAEVCVASEAPFGRRLFLLLAAIAMVYAFLASLRTISDNDLTWQMATGRWVAQHHQVFSTDVFSYTAYGNAWVYPVGSGLLLYFAYLAGGYTLLSWIGALACAATVAVLLRRGSLAHAGIAIFAVPLIAYRCVPHADMFTVVLFATYLSLLWENFQTGRARLWILPLLMIAWVNLHLGFISGLALMAAFVAIELLEMISPGERRQRAMGRLRRDAPWFGATLVATLANPWGWGIYGAVIRQDRAMAEHARWITEWFALPLNWMVVLNSLSLRSTVGAVYWVLAIAAVCLLLALLQRQFGAALLLAGASYQSIHHMRMEALTACVVIAVGGSVLHAAATRLTAGLPNARLRSALEISAVALCAIFAGVQSLDRINSRPYLVRNDIATFGAGVGWRYPQGAVEFVRRTKPPGNIINTLDEGGYLLMMLGDNYRDYIDGRAIPFGPGSLQRQQELLQTSLDSELWRGEAERYHANTFILPLARVVVTPLTRLKLFCSSATWRPVYLDEISVVLIRRTAETEDLIRRYEIDCSTAQLPVQPLPGSRSLAFNRWANAAAVLDALDRPYEALGAANKAQELFPDSGYIHWLRGNLFAGMGRVADAEAELQEAVRLDPSENTWASLGMLQYNRGRDAEGARAMEKAIAFSLQPSFAALRLARFHLQNARPELALQALDTAVQRASAAALAESGAQSLRFQVEQVRAEAWYKLGELTKAIAAAEEATRLAPGEAPAWSALAKLYERDGRSAEQQAALDRASELKSSRSSEPARR